MGNRSIERDQFIQECIAKGMTQQEIADELGVTRQRIGQIVKRLGLVLQRKNIIIAERKVVWQKLLDQGFNFSEIAKQESVSGDTVSNFVKEHGLVLPPKPKDIHGTKACYKAGCHCDLCREANTEYMRKYKGTSTNFTHGAASGYHNHLCKCDPCKKAGSDYNREARLRRLQKQKQTTHN